MKIVKSVPVLILAVALFALGTSVPAFSETKGMSMNEHKEGHGSMMAPGDMDKMGDMMGEMMGMCIKHADKMGLSDEQVAQMKPTHNAMQKKQVRYKADVKIAELELKEILEVKDFDLEKANAAVKKIAEIKTAHHLEMLKAMKEIRTMLTDDQFKKMKKMMPMKMEEKKSSKKIMKKHH